MEIELAIWGLAEADDLLMSVTSLVSQSPMRPYRVVATGRSPSQSRTASRSVSSVSAADLAFTGCGSGREAGTTGCEIAQAPPVVMLPRVLKYVGASSLGAQVLHWSEPIDAHLPHPI